MNRLMMMLLANRGLMNADPEQGGGGQPDEEELDMSWLLDDDEQQGGDDDEQSTEEGGTETDGDDGDEQTQNDQSEPGDENNDSEDEPESEPEQKPDTETEPKPEELPTPKPEVKDEPQEITDEERQQKHQEHLSEIEKKFAISDDDANLLMTAPEQVLPRLMTQAYDAAMQQVAVMANQLYQDLPNLINQTQAQQQEASNLETRFRELNPALKDLDDETMNAAITTLAPTVANLPGLTADQRLEKIGQMIAAMHGINVQAEPAPEQKPKPARQKRKPFQPASQSTGQGADVNEPTGNAQVDFISDLINQANL